MGNPLHVSHCASGDVSEYFPEIEAALDFIHGRDGGGGGGGAVGPVGGGEGGRAAPPPRGPYAGVLGYAHSTGAPILLSYLIAHGDAAFDGFVFNSPFLYWGWDVGGITKWFIRHVPGLLMWLRVWDASTELTSAGGPNSWALQFFSQYQRRPLSMGRSAKCT
jgi:alpha-beta hydrolase superfamily lysophospholipase